MTDHLEKMIVTVLSLATGAAVSGFVGLMFAHYWRVRNAKDTFLVFVSQKRGMIPKRDARDFYANSKGEIRDAVFKVRPFLRGNKVITLDRLWLEYDEIPYHELAPENEASWLAEFHKRFGGQYQSPSDILTFYLDEFCKIAA